MLSPPRPCFPQALTASFSRCRWSIASEYDSVTPRSPIGVNLGLFPHVDLDLDLDVDLMCDQNALTLGASELFGHGRVSRWRSVGHSDYKCQEANYSLLNIVFAIVQVCNGCPRPGQRPSPRGSRGLS